MSRPPTLVVLPEAWGTVIDDAWARAAAAGDGHLPPGVTHVPVTGYGPCERCGAGVYRRRHVATDVRETVRVLRVAWVPAAGIEGLYALQMETVTHGCTGPPLDSIRGLVASFRSGETR